MMTSDFLLYWAMIAISLFNTILLFWLGWTVLLNAQKRTGGIWLATVGLLVGGVFFATHTAMLGSTIEELILGVRSWWYFFFAPIVVLPYAWYLLMLWYAGFWDDFSSALHRRHRFGLTFTTILVLALIALLLIANPFNFNENSSVLRDLVRLGVRVFPIAAVVYPLFIFSCLGLALDALHRPAPSGRMMGDLARRRARPWLLAATLAQFIVSILVGAALSWLLLSFNSSSYGNIVYDGQRVADFLDLILIALIALTIILMGKAIVSYEIFTGKTLPRQGFLRQWRGVVTISLLGSMMIAWCVGVELRPIYALLLVVILMSFSFALLSWRFFKEREMATQQLRPFVASQHFYDRVLSSQHDNAGADGREEAQAMFRVLCETVLEARGAKLIPLGALAPLAGAPLYFPDAVHAPQSESTPDIKPGVLCASISTPEGLAWQVPLRDARDENSLNGVLLLSEKRNGGLYTEEEIEVARAGGERLLDALAGAALASRLMELQRRRLSEIQIADHQTRRLLHDEVLPRLHTAMLLMSGDENSRSESQNLMAEVHKEISSLLRAMPSSLSPPIAQLGLLGALQKSVEEEFARDFENVRWEVSEAAREYSQTLSPLVGEVLFHAAREAVRNAAKYGRVAQGAEDSSLQLYISAQVENEFRLTISDNGVGLNRDNKPENSTSGSGQGLALHSTMMAVIGGRLAVENQTPHGVRAVLSLPLPEDFHAERNQTPQELSNGQQSP
jgi:signal transduction histidine kinase